MGNEGRKAVRQPEARPAMLAHSAEAEIDAIGSHAQHRLDDREAQRAAEHVAADLRELIEDLIVRGDDVGLESILASVRGLASAKAAIALARQRTMAP